MRNPSPRSTPPLSRTSSSILNDTFGSGEGGLRSFPAVAAVVLIEGQTVLSGSCHHLGVGLQLLGSAQDPGSVDAPGVCVRHVQLAAYRVSCQVIPVGWVVAAFKEITQGELKLQTAFIFKSSFFTLEMET